MATPKKSAKPAPKNKKAAPAKKVADKKSVKKATPAKKPAPVKKAVPAKVVKKVPAKPMPKKGAPAKVEKKPVAQKPAPKSLPKPAAKPVSKAATPVKAVPAPKKPESKVEKVQPAPVIKKAEAVKPIAKPVATAPKANAKDVKDIKVAPPKPVVIPKILTKTAKRYQPDFTRSVLDQQPKNEQNVSIVRYSDSELMEFKDIIHRKLEDAKKELTYLQGLITRKDQMGGDESENRYMTMEDGSLSMEREQLSQMASRQINFIDHLEKALMRIENKTYGICRVTGKLIDKARLRAVPHATLSIEAKMGMKK